MNDVLTAFSKPYLGRGDAQLLLDAGYSAMQTIRSAGIENVRTYLGHKSIASTGSYLQVDDDAASRAIAGAAQA